MAKFDSLTDIQFEQLINSCSTWKELGEKLGYANTLSSNLKAKLLKRCNDLGIQWLEVVSTIPIQNKTKKEIFDSSKNWQSARSSIRRDAHRIFFNENKNPKSKM